MPTQTFTNTMGELVDALELPRVSQVFVPAQAAAANFEFPVLLISDATGLGGQAQGGTVYKVSVVFATAITGAATNYATLTVRQYRAGTLVGTQPTNLVVDTQVSKTAFTEVPLVTATFYLQAGDILTLRGVISGTGVALPATYVAVQNYTEAGES